MGRCKPPGSVNSFLSYAPHLSGTKSCLFVHFKEWQCCRRLLLAFPSPATPVFWPVKSHGQRSLVGYSTWGCNESDKTEQINTAQNPFQLLSNHCGVLMVAYHSFGSPHPHWGPEIVEVCAIYGLLICQEMFSFLREKSISYSIYFIKSACA